MHKECVGGRLLHLKAPVDVGSLQLARSHACCVVYARDGEEMGAMYLQQFARLARMGAAVFVR